TDTAPGLPPRPPPAWRRAARGGGAGAPQSGAMHSRRPPGAWAPPPNAKEKPHPAPPARHKSGRKVLVAELNRSESRLCGSNSNPQKVLCDGHQTKIACEAQGTGFLGVSLGARPL